MSTKKNNLKKVTRRDFVKNASLAVGGFMIVPRHVLGRGFIAPSDKLNIAGIDEANQFVQLPRRDGWKLPTI